jgi:hypothetical protein
MDIEDSGHLKENEDLRDLKDALRAQVAQPVAGAVEVSRSGRRTQSTASAVSSPSVHAFSSAPSLDSKATSAPPLVVSPFILQLSAPSAGAPATKNNTTAAARRSDCGTSGKMWILNLQVKMFMKSLRRLGVAAHMVVPALTKTNSTRRVLRLVLHYSRIIGMAHDPLALFYSVAAIQSEGV